MNTGSSRNTIPLQSVTTHNPYSFLCQREVDIDNYINNYERQHTSQWSGCFCTMLSIDMWNVVCDV